MQQPRLVRRLLQLWPRTAVRRQSSLAEQLQRQLTPEVRAALLRQHVFVGSVGYFNPGAAPATGHSLQPTRSAYAGQAQQQMQLDPSKKPVVPSAFAGGRFQHSDDTQLAADLGTHRHGHPQGQGDDDAEEDDDEDDEEDEEDELLLEPHEAGADASRFVICLLGSDLNDVAPAEVADLGKVRRDEPGLFKSNCALTAI